jgi:asparagine synthase (glutamine-hydrolysing)
MNSTLAHRGPNGSNVLSDGAIGFAFRRLSILDLSDRALQPLVFPDKGIWLLFNGEIHNYPELRTELEEKGHSFSSSGDTEVVLRAFVEWEYDCFLRFNGMWAIALWIGSRNELILSRDRFGIKPLYYSHRGARIAFASEAKAILEVCPEERAMNETEAVHFLVGGSPDDGGSETFFRNVKTVPAGNYLSFTTENSPRPKAFWDLQPVDPVSSSSSEEELRYLLEDSVRIRLRADVPLGACLSGGLDSSSVTRLAARMQDQPMHCFSLRYPDYPALDESRYAAAVADQQDRYIVHWVAPRAEDLMTTLEKVVWHHDAPTPLRGRLAKWVICEEASKWVTVALVGEGGDELLAGYGRFILPYILDRLSQDGLRDGLSPKSLKDILQLYSGITANPLQALLQTSLPLVRKYSLKLLSPTWFISRDLLNSVDTLKSERFYHTWLRKDVVRPYSSHLNNALWHDFRQVGLPETLHSDDALSMAFSLETRPPFLDHRLVEFCFGLRFDEKIRNGMTKSLLRRAMKDVLPPAVLHRRDKKGMPTPYVPFFTLPENVAAIRELLLHGELVRSGILDTRGTGRIINALENRLRPLSTTILSSIWRTATLELWFRQFISANRKGA